MARNTIREQRPLFDVLCESAKSYREGLIFRVEISSVTSPRPILLSGHNVIDFDLDLRCGGFTGSLCFLVSDSTELQSDDRDTLITLFRQKAMLKLRMTIQAFRADQDINTAPIPIEVNGLVTESALTEHVAKLGNDLLSYRRYYVRFADPAQVLWRQHFPCELFTQKSLRQVIDAHRTTHIIVEYPDLDVGIVQPMIFLGCDSEHRSGQRASFYDLLMWRLDEQGKVWRYDYTRKVYQIHGTKPAPIAFDIIPHDIDRIITYYPDYPRYQKNVLNDFVGAAENRPIDNINKVLGIRHDHLFNTEIRSELEGEIQKRTTAFMMPRPEFLIHYRTFPSKPYFPNVGIDFRLDLLDFSAEDIAIPFEAQRELCRVYRITISGHSDETDIRQVYDGLVPAKFHCHTSVFLEQASDPELRIPPYILPSYPVAIEGRVVSEVGISTEETYQFYQDPRNSLQKYKVMIPLFANQIITTPYHPNTLPGQFYFPLYKYERILVDLYFDKAEIRQFREWRATAQLPMETQGDQLLLGKTPINRTSVQHSYENERPVFEIERLNQYDSELLKIAEGNLLLQVGIPPMGVTTGTVIGRKIVVPQGLPAVPPIGAPALPGGIPAAPTQMGPQSNRQNTPQSTPQSTPQTPVNNGPANPAMPQGNP